MKSKFVSLFLYISFFTLVFSSCKTDVNIFSEGEETTIVYGYLDVDADTNYVKITKSFVGNALENAPIYSSSNYDYKLMVSNHTIQMEFSIAAETKFCITLPESY